MIIFFICVFIPTLKEFHFQNKIYFFIIKDIHHFYVGQDLNANKRLSSSERSKEK